MEKNMDLMKKIIEEKKMKSAAQKNSRRPDRYGNQSSGSGKIKSTAYGK